jgi:hypothetical protein
MELHIPINNRKSGLEKEDVKSYLIFGMCIVYIIQFFVNSYYLQFFLSLVCVVVFFSSLLGAKLIPRLFGLGMFITGISINLIRGNKLEVISNDITANLPLLALFILVPLISIPMKIEGYFNSVTYFMKKIISDSSKIFASISFTLFCLGPVLNIGSIRLLHEMINDLKINPIILAKSYLVGFSTVVLWSPYIASVALVLSYLNISIAEYLPVGITMAFFQLTIGNLLFGVWAKNNILKEQVEENFVNHDNNNSHQKKVLSLIFTLFFLMGLTFILEVQSHWPMMFLVCLMSICYPIIWCLIRNRFKEFRSHLKVYQTQTSSLLNNEIILFLSAGLFGRALSGTVFADGIQFLFYKIANVSFLLFSITIMLTILTFTFLGVHQIVVVTVLVTQINPSFVGTTPVAMALLIMTSWSMSSIVSPVNPLNLLVSNSLEQPSLAVGVKWNGIYLISMFIIGILFVYIIH